MPITYSATQARIHFGELMRQAQEEAVIVERDGKAEVVVLAWRTYAAFSQAEPNRLGEPPAAYLTGSTSLIAEARKIADERGISLEELLNQALEMYVQHIQKEQITAALNQVYADQPSKLEPAWLKGQIGALEDEAW